MIVHKLQFVPLHVNPIKFLVLEVWKKMDARSQMYAWIKLTTLKEISVQLIVQPFVTRNKLNVRVIENLTIAKVPKLAMKLEQRLKVTPLENYAQDTAQPIVDMTKFCALAKSIVTVV